MEIGSRVDVSSALTYSERMSDGFDGRCFVLFIIGFKGKETTVVAAELLNAREVELPTKEYIIM